MIEFILNQLKIKVGYTLGKDSVKKNAIYATLIMANVKENMAGQNHQLPVLLFKPHAENAAPVTGPIIKPTAKATPTKALNLNKNRLTYEMNI